MSWKDRDGSKVVRLIGVLLCLFPQFLIAQTVDEQKISGNFEGITFSDFATRIEAQVPCVFYFNKADIDSVRINFTAQDQPLSQVLRTVLSGTDLQFAIDKENRIFIAKGIKIQTELPFMFFEKTGGKIEDTKIPDYNDDTQVARLKAAAESKIYEIGMKTTVIQPGTAILTGHIKDVLTGEPIVGAIVYADNSGNNGAATDEFGYYTIALPKGKQELKIKSIGMKPTKRQIVLYGDGKLNIEMKEDVVSLKEVVVGGTKDVNVKSLQMGVEKLDIKAMKQIPTVFGETDVLRVVMALPGVQTVGESSTGLNVRGGATDQNLILFNDATIYNPSHMFGFFSAFNPDAVKNVELHKSSIPAEYGGRLSSVLSINGRDGNKKKFAGAGGIGLLTTRLTLEVPIFKGKTSLLVGGRTTYSDWLLRQLPSKTLKNSAASFYDLNAQITHDLDEKNTIRISGYYSADRFKLNSDTAYSYNNKSLVVKWSHIFNNKFYGVFTGSYSGYQYNVKSESNAVNAYNLSYNLSQINIKSDLHYSIGTNHHIDYGAAFTTYLINPGDFQPVGGASLITPMQLQAEKGLESAIYIADKFDVTPRLSVYGGIRYSMFNYLGGRKVMKYVEGLPITEDNVADSISYGNNEIIQTYHGPELRLSGRYAITENTSVKISYNRTRQYINMLSNTTAIAPTDIWKLSDNYLRPQVGDQYSLGFYKNFNANTIETSVEAYYKDIKDAVDYKNGASLILNPHLERDVINAKGKAYGIEFMVKKNAGKLNGWVSYAYSRSLVQINDPANATVVNRGVFFPTNYDKPHSINFIGNYKFSQRFSISVNVVYSTGRPITIPYTKYVIDGAERVYYSDRNEYRIPDYFRTDISLNIEGNHKIKKLAHSSWTIAVYNVTGRENVYSIYFKTEGGVLKGYQMSIFAQPIPTLTYNFRF